MTGRLSDVLAHVALGGLLMGGLVMVAAVVMEAFP